MTIYLISGTSRGIGYGIVEALSQREGVTIYAGVRDPEGASKLEALAAERPEGRIRIIKLISADAASNRAAAEQIKSEVGTLDVVIANAGISLSPDPAATVPLNKIQQQIEVNSYGPLVLFQAVQPLLNGEGAKFMAVSSVVSLMGKDTLPLQSAAYGGSKALLNFFMTRIHLENKHLVAFPCSPGFVETDMGGPAARSRGMARAPVDVADSAAGLIKLADTSTRESHGGRFWEYNGKPMDF